MPHATLHTATQTRMNSKKKRVGTLGADEEEALTEKEKEVRASAAAASNAVIVDAASDEDDAVFEQAGIDVPGAFSAVRRLNDCGDKVILRGAQWVVGHGAFLWGILDGEQNGLFGPNLRLFLGPHRQAGNLGPVGP